MIEAVVQVGALETRYARSGRGPHLLVLSAAGGPQRLVDTLAERFRVYLPQLPEFVAAAAATDGGETAMGEWLRGVIDGLGLDRPAVIADGRLKAAILRFVATDRDRIGQVALIGGPDLGDHGNPFVRGFPAPQDPPEVLRLMEFLEPVPTP